MNTILRIDEIYFLSNYLKISPPKKFIYLLFDVPIFFFLEKTEKHQENGVNYEEFN